MVRTQVDVPLAWALGSGVIRSYYAPDLWQASLHVRKCFFTQTCANLCGAHGNLGPCTQEVWRILIRIHTETPVPKKRISNAESERLLFDEVSLVSSDKATLDSPPRMLEILPPRSDNLRTVLRGKQALVVVLNAFMDQAEDPIHSICTNKIVFGSCLNRNINRLKSVLLCSVSGLWDQKGMFHKRTSPAKICKDSAKRPFQRGPEQLEKRRCSQHIFWPVSLSLRLPGGP